MVIRYYFSSHKRPYQVLEFLEMFLTYDPTQPTKKLKIST